MSASATVSVSKISVSDPFGWFSQAARFTGRHFGSIFLLILVEGIVTVAFNAVPILGSLLSNIVATLLGFGVVRYLMELERQGKSNLRTLFSVIDHPEATKALVAMFFTGILVTIVAIVLFIVAAFIMLSTQGVSFMSLADKTAFLDYISSHGIQVTFLSCILVLPLGLLYGAFYFVIPLVSVRGLGFMDALKASFEATLVNWWPFVVFELTLFGVLLSPLLLIVMGAVSGNDSLRMGAIGGGLVVFVIAVFLFVPVITVFRYSAYLGMFENRALSLDPPPPESKTAEGEAPPAVS